MFKIDKKYLPSKNFLTALSVSVVIIMIAIIINYWKTSTTKYSNKTLGSNDVIPAVMKIDTDEDGLEDWKENLYGTDPKKVDTDDDGTTDADEIAQDREPLKANTAKTNQEPNDKIDALIIEENKRLVEEYKKLSETDKFARDLFSNIIASQPVSGAMSEETVDTILAKSLAEIPQRNYVGITKTEDLTLLKTDNTNIVKNLADYAKNFTTETSKLKYILFTDLEVINSYIESGDVKYKSELLKIADKYQVVVNSLIKMPVPVAIGYYDINYHLAVINSLEKIIAVDTDIATSPKDSLGIFANLAIYNSTIEELIEVFALIESISKN